jgi:xylulokinase
VSRQAVLGVDVGTSSLKAGLFTLSGEPLGSAHVAYGLSMPEPGAEEQDPDDWWRALAAVSRTLLAPFDSQIELLAVAIGGMAPTLCPVDAELHPTHPAITWLDQRTADEAERVYARLGRPIPGWGSWPAQVAWLVRHRAHVLERTRWLMGCPDYLVARLTERPVSLLEWRTDEVEAAGVDLRMVPPQVAPGDVVGTISQAAASATGLPAGTPVVAGFVDGIMGVLGSGVQREGDACMNSGTSGTFSVVTRPGNGYPVLGMWVVGAATNTSGKALDWFADGIAPAGMSYAELLDEAAGVPAGAGGLLFLPYLAGERAPVQDARARGAWVGLTLGHDRRHMLRALLEGVAFSFRSVQESLAEVAEVYCVGGQAHSALWNQIKADVLNTPVLVPEVVEAAVVGAAILAAVGLGAYAGRAEAVTAMVHVARRFEPVPERAAVYNDLYAPYSRLYPSLRETSWRLHELSRVSSSQAAARSIPSA